MCGNYKRLKVPADFEVRETSETILTKCKHYEDLICQKQQTQNKFNDILTKLKLLHFHKGWKQCRYIAWVRAISCHPKQLLVQ